VPEQKFPSVPGRTLFGGVGLRNLGLCFPCSEIGATKILNYFDYHVTKCFVEEKNKRTKVIKRMAYGYRNIDNFRRRIFLSNNEIAANTKVSGGFHAY